MKSFKLHKLLTFSSKERSGIIVLTLLLILSIAASYVVPRFANKQHDLSRFSDEIYEFQISVSKKAEQQENNNSYYQSRNQKNYQQTYKPMQFDPNLVNKNKLTSMGFNSSQIKNLMNFRKSGGKFYQKEDFLKLYTIDTMAFNLFKPFITIPEKDINITNTAENSSEKSKKKHITIPLEINSCTKAELITKLQIPDYLADRVIKYRNLLGGFNDYSQFSEIYGFNPQKIDTNRIKIHFDQDRIEKINLNNGEFKEIISHPYIDKYTTNAILEYRKFMKTITSLDELKENNVLTDDDIKKIKPYVTLK
jgi:competence protein ComEA